MAKKLCDVLVYITENKRVILSINTVSANSPVECCVSLVSFLNKDIKAWVEKSSRRVI